MKSLSKVSIRIFSQIIAKLEGNTHLKIEVNDLDSGIMSTDS
ncbi:MAG: hypothetical protein Q7V19_18780 [Bacteroidales bacterium]|nr:hypothetical protein [Bacteroidales bacterium]